MPGLVDTHSHNVMTPLGQKTALRDGVTTPLELEFGVLPVDKWYSSWEGKSQTNYGATASIMGARESTLNPKFKSVTGASLADLENAKVFVDWLTSAEAQGLIGAVRKGGEVLFHPAADGASMPSEGSGQ